MSGHYPWRSLRPHPEPPGVDIRLTPPEIVATVTGIVDDERVLLNLPAAIVVHLADGARLVCSVAGIDTDGAGQLVIDSYVDMSYGVDEHDGIAVRNRSTT